MVKYSQFTGVSTDLVSPRPYPQTMARGGGEVGPYWHRIKIPCSLQPWCEMILVRHENHSCYLIEEYLENRYRQISNVFFWMVGGG